MGAKAIQTLRYWFRQKFNLTPNDPRYLGMTDIEIAIEYEADLAYQGETLKECPRCHRKTHARACIRCETKRGPLQLTGDIVADAARADEEDGLEVDLDAAFSVKREDFIPVKPGEL